MAKEAGVGRLVRTWIVPGIRRLVACGMLCLVTTRAYSGVEDSELRTATRITHSLSENVTGQLQVAFRWNNNFFNPFHQHIQPGLVCRLPHEWQAAAHYRLVAKRQTNGAGSESWKAEHQPIVEITKRLSCDRLSLGLRQRLQWKSADDQLNYRVRAELRLPKRRLWALCVQPLLSEEVFYELGGRFLENRNTIGMNIYRSDASSILVGAMTRHRQQFFGDQFDLVWGIEWTDKLR